MLRQVFSYLMAGTLGLFLAVNASAAGPAADAAAIISELGLKEAASPLSKQPRWAPKKVVITAPGFFTQVVPDYRERLHAVAGDVELVFDTSGEFVPGPDLLAGADALIGFCSPAAFERIDPQFLWMHNYFVGMDRCASLTDAQVEGRVFTNGKRLSGPTIAEHVMAMVLSLARGMPAFQRAQGKNQWDRAAVQSVTFGELHGKTLLVAGLGGIGTEVAWRAHALGMRVIATRNSSREGPEYVEYVGLADELLKLAGRADVVVNALPLTTSTTDVFDAGFFAAMPKGGLFISVGRGRSTVTADLVAALQSGHLYGAGLDVTEPEPLPPESPLWQMDNVIITPHVAAAGADSVRRGASIAIENLRRYVAGEALLNPVNMGAGY
jgi:phosphoglycerate dehydrogenase-like enzyme